MLRENPHGTDPAGESIPFKLGDQLVEKEGEECCNGMLFHGEHGCLYYSAICSSTVAAPRCRMESAARGRFCSESEKRLMEYVRLRCAPFVLETAPVPLFP